MASQASQTEPVSFMETVAPKFKGWDFQPVAEECQGCDRITEYIEGMYCNSFPIPAAKWRRGPCNMATHTKLEVKGQDTKQRVGQQKQRKKK